MIFAEVRQFIGDYIYCYNYERSELSIAFFHKKGVKSKDEEASIPVISTSQII